VPTFAYLAAGRLFLQQPDAALREITSAFVSEFEERQAKSQKLHGWKSQSGIWGEMGMAAPQFAQWNQGTGQRTVRFRSLDRGSDEGGLTYLVDFGHMTGLFQYDPARDQERRLFHRNGFPAQDLHRHPLHGQIAMSVAQPDGTKRLVVCDADARLPREVTVGDSVDEMQRWLHEDSQRLVFQSAGVARDANGFATALGPYSIQKLDLQTEALSTIIEDDAFDLLHPCELSDGTLIYLRRPYRPGYQGRDAWTDLKDILLFPYRLALAGFHFLNFFSVMFSGQPLRTAGGPERPAGADPRFLSLWGQMVDTRKQMWQGRREEDRGLVPRDWQLIRRNSAGQDEILAEGVLAFDVGPTGDVLHTDGKRIRVTTLAGTTQKLGTDQFIERVVLLS
jgi:hypothetical protein